MVLDSVVCVAYVIAHGDPPVERDPPAWLIPALEHFRSRPNIGRAMCAAAIVGAWTLVHGKAQPRSERLLEACNMYWGVYRRTGEARERNG